MERLKGPLTPGSQRPPSGSSASEQTADLQSALFRQESMSRTVPEVTDGNVLGNEDWLGVDEGIVLGVKLGCCETLGVNEGV